MVIYIYIYGDVVCPYREQSRRHKSVSKGRTVDENVATNWRRPFRLRFHFVHTATPGHLHLHCHARDGI